MPINSAAPPEFLLVSPGFCSAYYAAQYLRTRNLAQAGVEVSETAEKLLKPACLGNFHTIVLCPVQLTAEPAEGESQTRWDLHLVFASRAVRV